MLKEGINGFCMALADSVPGVSGGTVAFILGFYDRFVGSLNDFLYGKMNEKKTAFAYLAKLGIGWVTGMLLSVLVLSALFESNIYTVSSLFMGFIAGSIPLIIKEEKESFRHIGKGIFFCVAGITVVAGIAWLNGRNGAMVMDLGQFSFGTEIRLFFIGAVAISAMFLPGISGSTLLLIFGAYIPVITAVRGLLKFDFSCFPSLVVFGLGILAGAATVIRGIQICLKKFRVQSVYAILGMMIGSFYAIVQGPATLKVPQAPLSVDSFQVLAGVAGFALVLVMQIIKERSER